MSSHGGASRAHRKLAVNEGGAARAHIRAAVTSAWGQSGHGDGSGCGSRRARRVFSGRGDYSLDRPDVICRGHGVGVRGALSGRSVRGNPAAAEPPPAPVSASAAAGQRSPAGKANSW